MGKLKWLFTEGVTDLTSYRLGQVQERERIIKLLEFPNGWHETVYVAGEGDEHFADSCVTCMNIALIKGEK